MAEAQRLAGKIAIITGAGSGMGKASVERFLEEGATVVALDIAQEGLDGLQIPSDRGRTELIDVCDGDAVTDCVNRCVEDYGRLDCFFNNAGVPQTAMPVEEIALEEYRRIMDVNVTSAFLAAQAVMPHMRAQKSGSFLITASTAGLRPRPNLLAYNASKFAVVGLAKALALEVGADNVRVNALCPVAARTPMLEQFGFGTFDETAKLLIGATPLGRVMEPGEIAAVAAFLASDDATFITGLALAIDGGRTI